ncbi:molybdenum cofactor guanylyltransferase MobA [Mesorhizobium sp. NBSH29]|uniref:molybdenum cofactor guanylyltransferase MobA n=1 Tax=Mesorhizobium sp. NBSH29 TaxID=2654249 RepID=UPI00189677EF|nr:molybdenum cofactor guanylyltransferase MobA [Mesorhizobium sp. NBSH29]QPC87994.1 molybdenum cofactor guanylyltransferase MobA [Mesorhizobium sp. NBSH29]
MTEKFPAVILAGGRSRRMGGTDKPLALLAGRSLIAHIIERLALQATPLAINANGDPARYASFGLPILSDPLEGFAGPLAGILAAMEWAHETGASHVLTVAGDTPFIPRDLAAKLSTVLMPNDTRISIAQSRERIHPVIGLWPLTLQRALRDHLAQQDRRKVMAFIEMAGFVVADFSTTGTDEADPFFNINTPDDLFLAHTFLEEQ